MSCSIYSYMIAIFYIPLEQ